MTQLLNPRGVDVGDNEVARADFHCTDMVLVVHPRLPYVFHAAHLRYAFVFTESCNRGFLIFTCFAHEVEGSSLIVGLVYHFGYGNVVEGPIARSG